MLNRVFQFALASFFATAIVAGGVANAQDEEPMGDPAADGTAAPTDADGDGTPDATDAAPADSSSDGMADAGDTGAAMKKIRIGVGGLVGFNLGSLGDLATLAFGGLVSAEYALQPAISLTARVGYLHFLTKEIQFGAVKATPAFHIIPIWLGGKYALGAETNHLFVAGELGINMNGGDGGSSTKLGLNVGAGYDMGPLSLGAMLTMYDLGHAGDSMAVNGTVTYYFVAL
jgi:hypothetical protein